MTPKNDLALIRSLASDEGKCQFYQAVMSELRLRGLDSDDLRCIIETELGENHCYNSKPTKKYYAGTYSDYFSIWIDECGCRMFLKLLIGKNVHGEDLLVVSSFKKDNRYDP